VEKYNRPQKTIWRMRIACWIPKATNTHSQCVILQQWFHERTSMVRYSSTALFSIGSILTPTAIANRSLSCYCSPLLQSHSLNRVVTRFLMWRGGGGRKLVRGESLRTQHRAFAVRFKNVHSGSSYEYTPNRQIRVSFETGIKLSVRYEVSLVATTP
jgi:hypothetical protein